VEEMFEDMGDKTIILRNNPVFSVLTIDQTKLPEDYVIIEMKNYHDIAEAIRSMKIRGAPLLGVAAAFALALTAYYSEAKTKTQLITNLNSAADVLRKTRPTAVNLFWAIDRILKKAKTYSGSASLAKIVIEEAEKIAAEDSKVNHQIGKNGEKLFLDGDTILTHCNAGALATAEYGTALGVITAAWDKGKKIKVIATETRPQLQGARLTTFELKKKGIPVTLITDNMVGYVMSKGMIDKIIVGADRIVKDAVINKIGTYTIAVLAKEHNIPFYVAAPKSTFDLKSTLKNVIIEQRNPQEITYINSKRIAPESINVFNPAFDITPLKYVTGIIFEDDILYNENDFVNLHVSNF